AVVVAPGIVAQQHVGAVLAYQQDDLGAQFLERNGVHVVVPPVEADDILHAQNLGGGEGLPQIDHVVVRVAVVAVLLVVGSAHVPGLVTFIDEAGDQAAHAVVGGVVVVVGLNHEQNFPQRDLSKGQGSGGDAEGESQTNKNLSHRLR